MVAVYCRYPDDEDTTVSTSLDAAQHPGEEERRADAVQYVCSSPVSSHHWMQLIDVCLAAPTHIMGDESRRPCVEAVMEASEAWPSAHGARVSCDRTAQCLMLSLSSHGGGWPMYLVCTCNHVDHDTGAYYVYRS